MPDVQTNARDRILDAAEQLMTQHGYEAVGVAELCRSADVKKGSFYHFFDSKQRLAIELLDRGWDRARTGMFSDSFGDAERGTIASISHYGDLLAANLTARRQDCGAVVGCRVGNFAVELAVNDAAVRERVAAILDEMRLVIEGSIVAGIGSGELSSELDPQQASFEIIVHMEGLMVVAKARQDPQVLSRLGDAARRLLT